MAKSKHKIRDTGQGSVRIIAGQWRGRRLLVPDLDGLRPSGDRSRETLFNWLQPHVHQARCADLFAGTGVLGMEAVSRGASSAVLVENSHEAAKCIRGSIETLGTSAVRLVESEALAWLEKQPENSLDLVFIDPPFGKGLTEQTVHFLTQSDCLEVGGLVYLESARIEPVVPPGPRWEQLREKVLGGVRMQLYKKL
ncbi:MAG TPA: 16S rRNA (guanine(966)-N(2))-methyltransferase RsmD [Xanthomonadales bacterium]|nr:16S rRNA (guanine(966)-N(2))-methyltransferase RsmD [Xanthomonadales bacterium]